MNCLIYGATGYTGALIARLAVSRGARPVLGARDAQALGSLAASLSLEARAFALERAGDVDAGLNGIEVVLHCAGPFSRTARPMIDACLRTRTHYLDINGDIDSFEETALRDADARAAGIMLLPGAGFDVVPSDCLALHLKERLPGATHLALGFQSTGGVSRGTATTVVEGLHRGGAIRRNGVLEAVPIAHRIRLIDFGRGPQAAMTLPWGDVATAWRSTRIPNIEVYLAAPLAVRLGARALHVLRPLLAKPRVQGFLIKRIQAGPPGPSDPQRAAGASFLWGEVRDDRGGVAVTRLRTPDGYTLTSLAALALVERVLSRDFKVGYQTPAMAYGADFISTLPGCQFQDAAP